MRKELNEKRPEISELTDSDSPAILQSLNDAQEALQEAETRTETCRAALIEFHDLDSQMDASLNVTLEVVDRADKTLTDPLTTVGDLGDTLRTLAELKSENVGALKWEKGVFL